MLSTQLFSRRDWLKTSSCGFGHVALLGLLSQTDRLKASEAAAGPKLHFPPRAKRVIFVFLQGAPSHIDTFDYKPRLQQDDGKPEAANSGNPRKLLGSPWKFSQHGQSGQWISELFPHLATHADRLCVLKSLTTDIPNHPQAVMQMHTGSFRFTRPSLGSWVLYGLGSENEQLPGFIAFNPLSRLGGAQNYGNAFLPAAYQATRIGAEGENIAEARVEHISNPRLASQLQRKQLDLLRDLSQSSLDKPRPQELDNVIQSYELAFRMQGTAPQLLDLAGESQETLDLYGVGKDGTDGFGRQCLLARRCVEAGVRFVEITYPGWDHHRDLRRQMTRCCHGVDQPVAALLTDLARRGLLEETVVLFGGEFGRTASGQNGDGRDHNAEGFSMWLAGAGIKGGMSYGATDEYGAKAVENKMHIYDLQATLLHALGLDHEKLTYRYAGRDFRLTDVHGRVVQEILS